MSQVPEIVKSTRHSKIVGDFGEHLILYWLSKHGFECARIDHVGVDLIARNPKTKELMGISVKSRTRTEGKEKDSLNIPKGNFDKAKKACEAFGCVPYFAIVVDMVESIKAFILPLSHLLRILPLNKRVPTFKMTPKHIEAYCKDPEIIIFEFKAETKRWWGKI
jgi:hypothetical protein